MSHHPADSHLEARTLNLAVTGPRGHIINIVSRVASVILLFFQMDSGVVFLLQGRIVNTQLVFIVRL